MEEEICVRRGTEYKLLNKKVKELMRVKGKWKGIFARSREDLGEEKAVWTRYLQIK